MLDYETDEEAHFQCPQCGQKGSVPKTTLEKALAETPHVYISCSNCSHKFEPFAPADEKEESQEAHTAPPVSPSPLHAHWAQHDDDDATDDEAADGHLPGWMMPIEKPQTEAQTEPQNTLEADTGSNTDDGSDTMTSEASAVEPTKESSASTPDTPDEALEAALDEAIAEEMAADNAPVTPHEPPANEMDMTAEGEAIAADTEPTEEEPTAEKALQSDEAPSEQEQSQPIESIATQDPEPTEPEMEPEPEAEMEPEMQPEPEVAPVAATINAALPATPAVIDAPQYETHDGPSMPPSKGPTGMLNGFLLVLVMVLLATGIFMVSSNRDAPSSSATPDAANAVAVQLQNAGFVRFTENGEAGIEVSIRFANPSGQVGVIGDFRIELKNQARERLVHWTILSEGETVAPGQTRTLTSVLFGPPKDLSHVDVVYPLED